MNTFDSLLTMTTLCTESELATLASKCKELMEDHERIKRNELRVQLMENLQTPLTIFSIIASSLLFKTPTIPDGLLASVLLMIAISKLSSGYTATLISF